MNRLFLNGKPVRDGILLQRFLTEDIGIFESMRTYGGKVFRLEDHLDRLEESAKTVGCRLPKSRRALKRDIQSLALTGDCFVRLTLWRGRAYVILAERKLAQALYQKGVALRTTPVQRSLSNASFPEAKSSAYQNAVLSGLQPRTSEVYEWVYLDARGYVTEVRAGNLFMVKEGVLLTPPTVAILNGVTRRVVIKCASQLGMSVVERPLMRHEIYNAEEAFLTNTSWQILPVRMLDGRRIGEKIPGNWTGKLQKAFEAQVKT